MSLLRYFKSASTDNDAPGGDDPGVGGKSLGSPLIDGIFLVEKMCIYSCVTLSTTLLMCAVQFNAQSACDASMFTSCIYIFLRLASKCLSCTRSPGEMVQKLNNYNRKHKITTLKIDSDNFTKLPATFLGENNNENQVKFAKFSTFC